MKNLFFIRRFFGLISFVFFYIGELIIANIVIAYDILTPTHRMKPAILAVPLDVTSDFQILSLSNLIAMTPGTLSLDVSDDKKVIFVHAMYVDDLEKAKKEIKETLEKRILELSK